MTTSLKKHTRLSNLYQEQMIRVKPKLLTGSTDGNLAHSTRKEYEIVCNMTPSPTGLKLASLCPSSFHFRNIRKNRYNNVLPNEKTRVILRRGDDDDDIVQNYINANHVLDEYISAQAPMTETIDDFWFMVWQQRSSIVVMLTRFVENNKMKAEIYWPDKVDTNMRFGSISITNTKINKLNGITVTKLELTNHDEDDEVRTIYHLHYQEWPDMGIPESTECSRHLICMVDFYRMITPKLNGPIICHCSAGIGRTGTFIASHHLISMLQRTSDISKINVPNVVMQMRGCRSGMIQTPKQYLFVYLMVNDWINQNDNDMKRSVKTKRRSLLKTKSLSVMYPPSHKADMRNMLTYSYDNSIIVH